MPVDKTAHEQHLDDEEQERYWSQRAHERRKELMRLCPPDRVIDREHLVIVLGQSPTTNRPFLLWRKFLLRGCVASAVPLDDACRALSLSPEQAEACAAEGLWWDPPSDYAREIPERYHGRLIGAR